MAGCPFADVKREGRECNYSNGASRWSAGEREEGRATPCAIPPSHADGTTNGLINVPNFLGDGALRVARPPLPPSLPSVYGSIRKCREDGFPLRLRKRHPPQCQRLSTLSDSSPPVSNCNDVQRNRSYTTYCVFIT